MMYVYSMQFGLSADASRDVGELSWACDFLVGHCWVISVLVPSESELATWLEGSWELAAFSCTAHSSITCTPTVSWSSPLRLTSIEDADTTAWDLNVKVGG